jgi:thioredoxin-like negative regulator of GroEL
MNVVELSEFDFHPRLAASTGTAIVMFSGPDCGACKRLEKHLPVWLSGHASHLFKVDVQRSSALAHAYEVFHLPSLFVLAATQSNNCSPINSIGTHIPTIREFAGCRFPHISSSAAMAN